MAMLESEAVRVSDHGELRCRERLGIPRRAVLRACEKALRHGERLAGEDLDRVTESHITHVEQRALFRHGQFVFVFRTEMTDKPVLVTVLLEDADRKSIYRRPKRARRNADQIGW